MSRLKLSWLRKLFEWIRYVNTKIDNHRYSTARGASRIAELGTHEELLTRQGTYAELFSMQAEGYR